MILSLAFLSGCFKSDPQAFFKRIVPSESDQLVGTFINLLGENKLAEMRQLASDDLLKAPDEEIQKVRQVMALGPLLSKKIVGYNRRTSTPVRGGAASENESISYELQYEKGWILVGVLLTGAESGKKIAGFHVRQIPDSIEKLNAFKLGGQSLGHYFFLGWVIFSGLILLYALGRCITAKIRRKWLWALAILFGSISLKYDWTAGKLLFSNIHVGLNLGVASAFYGPWLLDIMLPVGAIIFLMKRSKLISTGVNLEK